jgi:nicotinamidase-related amidase
MTQALLIIDIQNDYFPSGAMELVGSPEAGAKAGELLRAFRTKSLPIIHIQHVALASNATFFLPNTKGVAIHESVTPLEGETLFQKNHPNSFLETPLLAHLRDHQITELAIVGMMTHMCIDSSTRAASDLGFDCLLVHDACATKSLTFAGVKVPAEHVQASYLAAINGSFARVLSVNDVLSAL